MKNSCFTPLPIVFQLACSANFAISRESSPVPKWHFETDDTHLTLAVIDNRQVIVELRNPANDWNWTPKPSEVPLLNRVL
jgi:hypothetical protein